MAHGRNVVYVHNVTSGSMYPGDILEIWIVKINICQRFRADEVTPNSLPVVLFCSHTTWKRDSRGWNLKQNKRREQEKREKRQIPVGSSLSLNSSFPVSLNADTNEKHKDQSRPSSNKPQFNDITIVRKHQNTILTSGYKLKIVKRMPRNLLTTFNSSWTSFPVAEI